MQNHLKISNQTFQVFYIMNKKHFNKFKHIVFRILMPYCSLSCNLNIWMCRYDREVEQKIYRVLCNAARCFCSSILIYSGVTTLFLTNTINIIEISQVIGTKESHYNESPKDLCMGRSRSGAYQCPNIGGKYGEIMRNFSIHRKRCKITSF